MLIDSVTLTLRAGNGGRGAATFRRTAQTAKGGPDGGDGGNGGNIYAIGNYNLTDLRQFRFTKKIEAENGVAGGHHFSTGANAPHMIIELPLGTTITNLETNQSVEITDSTTRLLLAKGGIGGHGNTYFKSATNRAPREYENGTKGEVKRAYFNLRIIADVGFVGLPNVGKSSLLAALTNAKPEIANYPFTTLEPNIGMMGRIALADIPGLIEGASDGKGLGIKFLKHIEKTKILIHCIECTDPDPLKSYATIRAEFIQFNPSLGDKPEIIVFTKMDLGDETTQKKLKNLFAKKKLPMLFVSTADEKSLDKLKKEIQSSVTKDSETQADQTSQ